MKRLKAISKKIGDVQAFVLLSVIYFILVPVFALVLKTKEKAGKLSWDKWSMPSDTISELKKQY